MLLLKHYAESDDDDGDGNGGDGDDIENGDTLEDILTSSYHYNQYQHQTLQSKSHVIGRNQNCQIYPVIRTKISWNSILKHTYYADYHHY